MTIASFISLELTQSLKKKLFVIIFLWFLFFCTFHLLYFQCVTYNTLTLLLSAFEIILDVKTCKSIVIMT